MRKRKKIRRILGIVLLTIWAGLFAVLLLMPTVLTITNSFMSPGEITANYGAVFASNSAGGKAYISEKVNLKFRKIFQENDFGPLIAVVDRVPLSHIAKGVLLRLAHFAVNDDFPEIMLSVPERMVHLPAAVGAEGRGGPDGTVQNVLDRGAVRAIEILRDDHEFVRLADHAADLLQFVLHEALRRMFGPAAEAALTRCVLPVRRQGLVTF